MALLDYQREFNGLLLGDGTNYELMEESGLEGFQVRSGSRPIPRDDGAVPGLHLVDPKTVVIPVEVIGDPETEITPLINAALAAFAPSREVQYQYIFKNPGDPERFVWARPVRFERSRTVTGTLGLDKFTVALELDDPRIYSVELFQSIIPSFGGTGGGFNFPVVNFPINATAASQDLGVAINGGTRDSYPRFLFQYVSGTVSGVQVTNLTNGDILDINTTITTGQQLFADMDALIRATGQLVVGIGTSSRYGDWALPRLPFRLSPGSNSLKFEITGGGVATCSVTWRNTN